MFGFWFARRAARKSYAAGTAALHTGDDALALSWFESALRAHPAFASGFLGRGLVRLRAGEYRAAVADLTEAVRLGGGAPAYYLRSFAQSGTGDHDRARADRREALRLDPDVGLALNDPAARPARLRLARGVA